MKTIITLKNEKSATTLANSKSEPYTKIWKLYCDALVEQGLFGWTNGLLGGLDHIKFRKTKDYVFVKFFDIGINYKCNDIVVKIERGVK